MAETREGSLQRFFESYAEASLTGDVETIASSYAPSYIESSPDSFAAWKVDGAYRQALKERHRIMDEQLGLSGLRPEVISIEEVAPRHFLVPVRWAMTFLKAKAGKVTSTFMVSYILKLGSKPEILAYLSHESEEAVMRRDGVI